MALDALAQSAHVVALLRNYPLLLLESLVHLSFPHRLVLAWRLLLLLQIPRGLLSRLLQLLNLDLQTVDVPLHSSQYLVLTVALLLSEYLALRFLRLVQLHREALLHRTQLFHYPLLDLGRLLHCVLYSLLLLADLFAQSTEILNVHCPEILLLVLAL